MLGCVVSRRPNCTTIGSEAVIRKAYCVNSGISCPPRSSLWSIRSAMIRSGGTATGMFLTGSRSPQGPDDLRPALEWIAEKPEYKTSIPELAEKCGLSESTFRRKFTAVFGMSPARYLLRRRLTLSKEWLNGRTSIKEISARCGFSSPLRFALAFKNCFGETPSSFRMKKQQKNER